MTSEFFGTPSGAQHAATHLPGGSDPITFAASILTQGLYASRPAAGATNAGTYYFATDSKTVWRSDGSTWTMVAWDAEYLRNGSPAATFRPAYPRSEVSSNAQVFSSLAAIHFIGVPLVAGDAVGHLSFASGSTGLTVGSSSGTAHLWSELRKPDGTLAAYSADEGDAAVMAANTVKDCTIAFDSAGGALASYTATTTGMHLIGIACNPGSGGSPVQPTLTGKNMSASYLGGSGGVSGQPRLLGFFTGVYPPSAAAPTWSANGVMPYAVARA